MKLAELLDDDQAAALERLRAELRQAERDRGMRTGPDARSTFRRSTRQP